MINGYPSLSVWLYSQLTLIIGVGSFLLGFLLLVLAVWKKARKSLHNIWFFLCLAIGGWNLGYHVTMIPDISKANALIASRISHASGILIVPLFLQFSTLLRPEYFKNRKYILSLCYIICISFAGLSLTPFVVIDLIPKLFMQYYPVGGIGYALYILIFISWIVYANAMLIKAAKETTGVTRNQIKYFLFGTIPGFIGGATCFPLIFGIKIPPYPSLLIIFYLFTTPYAILKYRLLDINIALTRVSIFVIVYLLVLGIPFFIGYRYGYWQLATWITVILATAGPFISLTLIRQTEARFLKEERRAHELLKQASKGMVHIHNRKKLLDLMNHITTKTMKLENSEVFLLEENSGNFKLSAVRFRSKYHYSEIITKDDPLIQKLSAMEEPLVYEEVKLNKQELESKTDSHIHEIESQMRKLKAAVIVPAISNGRLVAFLVLGEKNSKRMYSQEDLSTLWALSYQAALAIDNAFLYEKEKMRLAEQSRRQALADMAPGASHQFNNRLATISATTDNLLDFVKNDAQNLSKEQLIGTVSEELEIIRGEVAKGEQITKAILQKAKVKLEFDKIDIIKVIQNAMSLIRIRRSRESLGGAKEPEFVFNYPEDLLLLTLCEGPIQDVFENIFNNAYDAIVIKNKRKIEPQGYQGKISIDISRQDNSIIIPVEDNGIGIQKDNLHRLFTDFFTTKATSEKGVVGGSGLGLGVMRSFVEEHGGTIAVESEYTKWTRFTVTLPVDFKPSK